MTTFFSCVHEILGRQHHRVYSSLTIRKECDDLNGVYQRQNEQTLLGRQIQLRITFLLDCNYVSFETLSCVQLSGFTSDQSPDLHLTMADLQTYSDKTKLITKNDQ